MLPLPTLQPKKAKSIMDKNLAALLRADAKTVHVKLPASAADNTPRKARPYTYVSHLPLAVGDSVVVMAAMESEAVLPEPENLLLVLDEGHHLPEVARDALEMSAEITPGWSRLQLDLFIKLVNIYKF